MAKKKKPQRLFMRVKPAKLLVALKEAPKYATILSKEIDCTYSHTVKLLNHFHRLGLVTFEKKGRIKMIELTSTGEDLAHAMEGLLMKLRKLK